MSDNLFYGWFDDAHQSEPTYDPGIPAPCPFCGTQIADDTDCRTHCFMAASNVYAKRSYFYRTHKSCDERNRKEAPTRNDAIMGMDGFIQDMIARNGD